MTKEQEKELDKGRAEVLRYYTSPLSEQDKHGAANLNNGQPVAMALFRTLMNRKASLSRIKFYDPRSLDKDNPLYQDTDFNPKYHFTYETRECQLGKPFMNNLLAGTMAVGGKRAKIVLETVKDIGRPQQNLFGQLGAMMGDKDEEYDEED